MIQISGCYDAIRFRQVRPDERGAPLTDEKRADRPIPWALIPLFQALKPAERETLRPLIRLRSYDAGEVIFREGDPGSVFHFIQEIADMVGTTQETAIRIMSRWGKDGIVETTSDGFVIPRRAAVEEIPPAD